MCVQDTLRSSQVSSTVCTRLTKSNSPIIFRFSYSQSFLDFPSQSATDLICSIYKQTPTKVKSNLAKGTFSGHFRPKYLPVFWLKTTKVNIFFGELNYQTISQIKAYDFASLLGDIGGQMGLFIGIVLFRPEGFWWQTFVDNKYSNIFRQNFILSLKMTRTIERCFHINLDGVYGILCPNVCCKNNEISSKLWFV